MYKKLVTCFFWVFLFTSSAVSYAASDVAAHHQAQQLYAALQQYPQELSVSWLDSTTQLLAQDDNSFTLIYAVCMKQDQCMSGAAAFPTEALGLMNGLKEIRPAVELCANRSNPFICVQNHAGAALVGMVTGDAEQLIFQLQSYL